MIQATQVLNAMTAIPESKTALAELSDKLVTQYVPESQRKEWTDTSNRYITELGDIRSNMEERVAVNNPKLFDSNGGKQSLENAKTLAGQASLDLKAWTSTYNVYLNADALTSSTSRSTKQVW